MFSDSHAYTGLDAVQLLASWVQVTLIAEEGHDEC